MTQQFEPFQKVLVRDEQNAWRGNFFMGFGSSPSTPFKCVFGDWEQCIPYEGNEHLLGTTNSPTPPEPEFRFGDKVEVSNDRAYWYKAIYLQKGIDEHHFPCVVAVHENNSTHANWTYCRKADW